MKKQQVIRLHKTITDTLKVNMEQCLEGSSDKVKDLVIQKHTHKIIPLGTMYDLSQAQKTKMASEEVN